MSYHLRIRMERDEAEKILNLFVNKFKPTTFVFSYEEVEDNHHIHGHLEYDVVPKKQTLSDFFKRHNLSGCYYHNKLEKEPINNLLYVLKDLDVIDHNLEQERYDMLIETTKRINDDKKKNARHKLFESIRNQFIKHIEQMPEYEIDKLAYQKWQDNCPFIHLTDIANYIIKIYVHEYDKEPPLAHLRAYSIYIYQSLMKESMISPLLKHMEIDYNQYLLKLF